MKRIPALILAALSLACAHPTFLAAAESIGTVEGRVFNGATGAALANARVRVEGTEREAITDAAGSYRLNNVPAGERVIAVFYVGLGRQDARVLVAPGTVAQRDFELASPAADGRTVTADQAVRMDAFSVVANSVMSAQSLAMNEQRHAANIKNVVAIDEFGDRGQENVGEYLHFLPGISVDVPGDSGPGSVSVRGFPPINSTFMLDSGEVAGARGDTRAASLQDVPMLNVSRIEVTKVPTPDMPASGLGGTVNLITKSAFETKTPVLTYDLYTQFNSSNGLTFKGPRGQVPGNSPDYIQPSYSLSYLRPINKRLAVSASVSRTWRLKSHDDNARDEIPTWDLISGFQRTSVWQAPVQLYKTLSGQFGVDLKVGENGTLSAGVQYREYSMP